MGFWDLFGDETIGAHGVRQVDTDEYFAVPLKRIEKDEVGLRNKVLPIEKNLSVMVLGQPGSGKTSTITFLAKQMQASRDEPVVIFDYKGDYDDKGIYDPNDAVVLSYGNSTHLWNVFEEGETFQDYQTIADALFQEEEGEDSNKFFTEGARDLFQACLYRLDEDPTYSNPTNDDLLDFIYPTGPNDSPADRIRRSLLQSNDRKVKAAASELDPNNPETATNMYQTLRKRVGRVFDGDFAKRGTFSIREYMADPQDRTLVFDMSGREQDLMAPMFRVFLDWSIKLALTDRNRYAYFILDEFDEVGELQQIQRLLSVGRAQLTEAVIGIQSRAQLEAVYDETGANTILENCPQKLLMRTDDDKEYVRDQIGTRKNKTKQMGYEAQKAAQFTDSTFAQLLSLANSEPQIQEEEIYPIEEQEIGSFDRGEGIFITEEGWVWGRFPLWSELSDEARRHLTGDASGGATAGSSAGPSGTGTTGRSVRLIVGSEMVDVPLGEPIGERIRDAYRRAGGNPDDAAYVHRDHIRFDRVGNEIQLTAVGRNDTELNGRRLKQHETTTVTDGDRIELSDRVGMTVDIDTAP